MLRNSALFLSIALFALAARGQNSPRPPWQWTDEERIAKRYNPASMHAREDAYVENTEGADAASGRDIVQGERNPELFLPFELYQDLLMRVFSPSAEASRTFRDVYLSRSTDPRIDDELWERLEKAARPYLDSITAQRALAKEYQTARPGRRAEIDRQTEERGKADCRLLIQNLEAARVALGPETLDRFLYEAVAPSNFSASVDNFVSADHLRYLAGGCQ